MNDDIQLIEAYLAGELMQEERQQVEARLKTDKAFDELFKREQILKKGIQAFFQEEPSDDALRNHIRNHLNSPKPPRRETAPLSPNGSSTQAFLDATLPAASPDTSSRVRKLNRSHWALAAAAGVVLLLVLASPFLIKKPTPNGPELAPRAAQQSEQNQAMLETQLDSLSLVPFRETQRTQAEWLSAYQKKKYSRVIRSLKRKEARTEMENFYLGLSYLHQGNPQAAIPHLEQSTLYPPALYPSQWYLGLAYLQAGDIDNARRIFEPLEEEADSTLRNLSGRILDLMPKENW
jgi:tetratricopeptide (TPR) repeat protein